MKTASAAGAADAVKGKDAGRYGFVDLGLFAAWIQDADQGMIAAVAL